MCSLALLDNCAIADSIWCFFAVKFDANIKWKIKRFQFSGKALRTTRACWKIVSYWWEAFEFEGNKILMVISCMRKNKDSVDEKRTTTTKTTTCCLKTRRNSEWERHREVNKRLRDLNVFNCSAYGRCLKMTSSGVERVTECLSRHRGVTSLTIAPIDSESFWETSSSPPRTENSTMCWHQVNTISRTFYFAQSKSFSHVLIELNRVTSSH